MDGAAIFFWIGMAGLLAVAILLGRWHAEEMAGRMAETRGRRATTTRRDAPARHGTTPQDPPRGTALPGARERAA